MLTQASKWTGVGLVALITGALVVPACSSGGDDDDTPSGGSGGSNSSGNAGMTSGGAKAGSDSGGTSGGGTAGSTNQTPSECPGVEPTGTVIADFDTPPEDGAMYEWGSADKGETDFWGGTFTYPAAVELSFDDGALTAAGNVADYSGFGLYVTTCADASAFEGIRFKIKGNPPMGKLQFALQTNRNEWANGMKGSCIATEANRYVNCVHPSVSVTVPEGDEFTTVEVKWADLGAGKPAADAKTSGDDIIGLQWILPWAEKGTPYDVSVTIDDVEFIGEGSGTGGSGAGGDGAGGSGTGPEAGGAGGVGGAP